MTSRSWSHLNYPVASSRCEALFPQNADAGVKPLGTVWEQSFLLLAGEAHLRINNGLIIAAKETFILNLLLHLSIKSWQNQHVHLSVFTVIVIESVIIGWYLLFIWGQNQPAWSCLGIQGHIDCRYKKKTAGQVLMKLKKIYRKKCLTIYLWSYLHMHSSCPLLHDKEVKELDNIFIFTMICCPCCCRVTHPLLRVCLQLPGTCPPA